MADADRPTFPNFARKHGEDSMFTPQDFLAYMRDQRGLDDVRVPPNIVMCYSPSLVRDITALPGVETAASPTAGSLLVLSETDGRVGVAAGFGIGAPAATTVFEELVAFGATRFVSIGAAGTLQRSIRAGDAMLCTAAVRDEGVSHHYLEAAHLAYPSDALTKRLGMALEASGVVSVKGTAWTIDAPYRETIAEARHYQEQGIIAVEMEAAALFAVAAYRKVEIAAAFIASDSLAEMTWTPSFGTPEVREGLRKLFAAAVAACDD